MSTRRRSDGPLVFAGRVVDLTPPLGTALAGYRARGEAVATGTLDPLEATVIRLRDPRPGGGQVIWVALDVLAVDEAQASSIAEAVAAATGCPREAVVVCASHTHSAPSGWIRGVHPAIPEPGDRAMRAEVSRRVAGALATMSQDEVPVRTVLAAGVARGVGTNRTDPAAPHDTTLGALCLVDDRGSVRGVLLDFASHATVLGHANRRWSADWPGAARRSLAAALRGTVPFPRESERGAGAADLAENADVAEPTHASRAARDAARPDDPIVAFLQGAAGDASPRFVRRSQDAAEKDRIGGLLAAQALTAILEAGPPEDAPRVVLVKRARVAVPTRPPASGPDAERLVNATEQAWQAAETRDGPGSPAERIARTRYEGALMAARLASVERPATMDLPISVVVVGDDAWIHLPVELYASYAAEIRAASRFRRTRVIGYTDGYFGYIADDAAHRAQVYEALASLFDAEGGRVLVAGCTTLLSAAHDAIHRDRLGTPADAIAGASGR